MNYRIFTGSSLQEAIDQARREFGDWIQLVDQKRKVERKGPLGLFGRREYFEVTVNVDVARKPRQDSVDRIRKLIRKHEDEAVAEAPLVAPVAVPQVDGQVIKELAELKETLARLVGSSATEGKGKGHDPVFTTVRTYLERSDFDRHLVDRLLDDLQGSLTVKQLSDLPLVRNRLEELLLAEIPVAEPLARDEETPRVLAFVGPTGVGKTTTIAKIGANLHLKEGRKVCFLTMDNYRIGGKEQLLQYAEIIDLPIRVVQQRDELIAAIENERTEYFLLDTAGRNQKKGLDLNEIRNNLRVIGLPLDIHLVVSATTKYTDLLEIMEKFEILGYERVILTKVDETNTFGSVISALSERKKRLAYICMGQNVPDDIKLAEAQDLVARSLMRLPLAGGEPSVVNT